MPAYTVTMDVDGEVVVETINGCKDATEAIKKAKDKHPTLVLAVAPFEVQMGMLDREEADAAAGPEPHEHPGQTDIDYRPDTVLDMGPPDGPEELEPNDPLAGLPEAPDPFGEDDPVILEPGVPEIDPAVAEAELMAMATEDDDFGLGS